VVGKSLRVIAKLDIIFVTIDVSAEFDILVRRCFAFDETETSLQLVDDRGCAVERLISNFEYDKKAGTAKATIRSMFRYCHIKQ
jgi:hypothetical protein